MADADASIVPPPQLKRSRGDDDAEEGKPAEKHQHDDKTGESNKGKGGRGSACSTRSTGGKGEISSLPRRIRIGPSKMGYIYNLKDEPECVWLRQRVCQQGRAVIASLTETSSISLVSSH
jgi:hypothetical protein